MTHARSRSIAAGVAAVFLLALGASTVSARVTPELFNLRWAWVTVRMPAATYDPAPKDQGNITGSTNHVTYSPDGQYRVALEHVGGFGGIVHVTPLGTTTNVCEVESWDQDGPDEIVFVACYTQTGLPAAQRFSLSYLATDAPQGKLAYLWANQPFTTDYAPDTAYSYNSKGGTNTVHRSGVGIYFARLPDLGSMKGSVQVTAYETTGTPPTGVGPSTAVLPSVCNVGAWGPSGDDMVVSVYCRDSNGVPTDSRFDLTFMQGLGLKGLGGDRVAYLFAHRPTVPSYTPDAQYRFSSAGEASTITREATGVYTATLPGMPKGGAAHVTAFGSAAKRCVAGSIRTDALPQRVGVRCYDFAGDPVNAKFTLAYER